MARRITVDKSKKMRDTTESRRPSVFERLGPGASGGRDGNRQDKCRNWLRDGHCAFGSKCHFQHGPYRSSEADAGDLRLRVESKRAELKKHSYDRSRSPSSKREKSKRNKDKDLERRKKKKSKEKKVGPVVSKRRSPSSEREDDGRDWDRFLGQDDSVDQDSEHERELERRRQDLKRQLAQMEELDSEREHVHQEKSTSESSSSSSSSSDSDSTTSSSSSSSSSSSDESSSRSPSPVSRKSKKKKLQKLGKREKGHPVVEVKPKRGRSREKKYKSGKDKRIISPEMPKRKHKGHSNLTTSKQIPSVSSQRSKVQDMDVQPKKSKHKETKGKGKDGKMEGKSKDVEKKRKRSRSGPKDDKIVAKISHQKRGGKSVAEVAPHKRTSLTPPPRTQKGRGHTSPSSKIYSPSTPTQSESPYSVNRDRSPSPVPQKLRASPIPFERYRGVSPNLPAKRGLASYGTVSQTSSRGPTPPTQFRKRPRSPSPSSSQRSYSPAVSKRSTSPRPRTEHYRTSSSERFDSRKSGKYTPTPGYKDRSEELYLPQDHGRGHPKYYRGVPPHPHMPIDDRYREHPTKYPPTQRHHAPPIQDDRRLRERGHFEDKRYDHHGDAYYRKESLDGRKRPPRDEVRSISPSQKRRHQLDSVSGRQRGLGQSPSPGPRDRRRDQPRDDYRRPSDMQGDRRFPQQGRDRYRDWTAEEQRDYRKEDSKERDARYKEPGPAIQEPLRPDEGRSDQGLLKRRREDDRSEQSLRKRSKLSSDRTDRKSVDSDVMSKGRSQKGDVPEAVFSDWSDEEGSEELWNADGFDAKKEDNTLPSSRDIQIKPVIEEQRREPKEYKQKRDLTSARAPEIQERARRSRSRGSTSSQQSSVSSDHRSKRQGDFYDRERHQRLRSESHGMTEKTEHISPTAFQHIQTGKEITSEESLVSFPPEVEHCDQKEANEEVAQGDVPKEMEEDLKESNVAATNDNIYDSFSDDDDIEKVLHNECSEGISSTMETKSEPDKAKDLLEIDWSSIPVDFKAPKEDATNQPGSALSRFTPGSILARIGVSRALAGPSLIKRIIEACKEATPEGGEVPRFDCALGAFNANAQQKAHQRKKLLSDVGPCRRALSARWDLQIRKQLRKTPRDIDASVFSASAVDPELYKHSLQLFRNCQEL
ncbi:zinc finger CCCH domain-containing protein 13-like [Anneissia japonica]|uniref:zinc finger CCCH domain-containing protein 13-like n=1 Tax=Anneissia japonica TaxID=1529436 RepID=UPI0014256886|nr:zinc finger CCCH domain-containing protein 13-like [Anneissia japonica]